jgi:hypothetical protein
MAKTKKEKSAEFNTNFVCTGVSKIAFDNEQATFENEDAKVTINIKNPAHQGQFVKGETYDGMF